MQCNNTCTLGQTATWYVEQKFLVAGDRGFVNLYTY